MSRYFFKACFFLKDGNWSDWSQWDSCSVTYGEGNQTRSRTCTNPVPSDGGKNCSNTNVENESQACNDQPNPKGNFWDFNLCHNTVREYFEKLLCNIIAKTLHL